MSFQPLRSLGDGYIASLSQGKCDTTRKIRFPDLKSAEQALELAHYRADRERRRRETRAYTCVDCGGYHLSSWSSWGD